MSESSREICPMSHRSDLQNIEDVTDGADGSAPEWTNPGPTTYACGACGKEIKTGCYCCEECADADA